MKRFFDKVNKIKNGCWEWTGAYLNPKSYGCLKYKGKVVDAHRVSWMIHNNKKIPKKMCICHKCDNKKCVNPDHLFLGTHSDNMKDAYDKGLINAPVGVTFKKGHKPLNRRLTDEEAKVVKLKILNRGNKTLKELAKEINLPYQLIRDISCGRVY